MHRIFRTGIPIASYYLRLSICIVIHFFTETALFRKKSYRTVQRRSAKLTSDRFCSIFWTKAKYYFDTLELNIYSVRITLHVYIYIPLTNCSLFFPLYEV
ncbi:hypothetical protein BDZ91DRAFT_721418, partial [Kalaharituber pfeilii]